MAFPTAAWNQSWVALKFFPTNIAGDVNRIRNQSFSAQHNIRIANRMIKSLLQSHQNENGDEQTPQNHTKASSPSVTIHSSRTVLMIFTPFCKREGVEQLLLESSTDHVIICDNLRKVYLGRDA